MTPPILKIHGFRVGDRGRNTIDQLDPYLAAEGFETVDVDYGRFSFARVRLCNACIASTLAQVNSRPAILATHSNGAAIAWEAARQSRNVVGIIAINPALDADTQLPEGVEWCDVYFNRDDDAVWWAKWLPGHPWGSMGRDGYQGPTDRRITQHDTGSVLLHPARGHSAVFAPDMIGYWGPFVARRAKERLGQ